MDIKEFLDPGRVVNICSQEKDEAIRTLVRTLVGAVEGLHEDSILEDVLAREKEGSTRLSPNFAMPHARVKNLPEKCYITIGRCPVGVDYREEDPSPVNLMALIVVDADEPELFLGVLQAVAKTLSDPEVQKDVMAAQDPDEVIRIFTGAPSLGPRRSDLARLSGLLVRNAAEVAEASRARAVMVSSDALDDFNAIRELPKDRRLILAGKRVAIPEDFDHPDAHAMDIPFGGDFRTRRIRLALLFCVGRGLLAPRDTVVCLTGTPGEGLADTLIVTSPGRECHMLEFGSALELLSDVRPEVLERTVQLAYEIAAEGREGKPIGTLFVLGDAEAVTEKSKQLVMNPFRGYPEDTRNILDPTLSETIKEFASIDGAFIVRGDGVVLAAGAYLTPGSPEVELPAGYGTRHQAAAAISAVTNAYGIAVSESTGTVTVYKKGVTLTTLERGRREAS